jgi:hypothetical protein
MLPPVPAGLRETQWFSVWRVLWLTGERRKAWMNSSMLMFVPGRSSRSRGECASTPHQGWSELHRHQAQILLSSSVTVIDSGPIPRIG